MTNGLKTVTKHSTEVGSKLLMLAMFPVPKKDMRRKKILNSLRMFLIIKYNNNCLSTLNVDQSQVIYEIF